MTEFAKEIQYQIRFVSDLFLSRLEQHLNLCIWHKMANALIWKLLHIEIGQAIK